MTRRSTARSWFRVRFGPAVRNQLQSIACVCTGMQGYNGGMRAPTPIQLTCANAAAAPCKRPTSSSPIRHCKKVVSKTIEAGARARSDRGPVRRPVWRRAGRSTPQHGSLAPGISAAFIASAWRRRAGNVGYFQNIGRTQRRGIER